MATKTSVRRAPKAATTAKATAKAAPKLSAITTRHLARAENVSPPVIPVDKMGGEARSLLKAMARDSKELGRLKLDLALATVIEEACDRMLDQHANILSLRKRERSPEERHAETSGRALRQDVLEDLEFVLAGDSDALERIAKIREGEGVDDLVDDLKVLAPFVREAAPKLKAIGLDAKGLSKEATAIAKTLGELVASRRISSEETQAVADRDRAATVAWAAMNEVRRVGRYLHRKEPKKAQDYTSTYNRIRRSVAKAKKTRAAKATPGGQVGN